MARASPTAQPTQALKASQACSSLPPSSVGTTQADHVQADHHFQPLVHRKGNEDVTLRKTRKINNPAFSRLAPFPPVASLPHAGANVSTAVMQAPYRAPI